MNMPLILLAAIIGGLFLAAMIRFAKWLPNPYSYPYFRHSFDVTGRRNVDPVDLIDRFLLDENNRMQLERQAQKIDEWKSRTEKGIESMRFGWCRRRRRRQYESVVDDEHAYVFTTCRERTRYHQTDYVRTPYKVTVTDEQVRVDIDWILDRCRRLERIGFETTIRDWNVKDQRRLMTPRLRKRIAERDNYTCQKCGKHMPDGIGLQIDHIVPVIKGGKTVESNLQVLCSKCNGHKGGRTPRKTTGKG